MCWCVDVLMCWCVDVLMCWCVPFLKCFLRMKHFWNVSEDFSRSCEYFYGNVFENRCNDFCNPACNCHMRLLFFFYSRRAAVLLCQVLKKKQSKKWNVPKSQKCNKKRLTFLQGEWMKPRGVWWSVCVWKDFKNREKSNFLKTSKKQWNTNLFFHRRCRRPVLTSRDGLIVKIQILLKIFPLMSVIVKTRSQTTTCKL